MNNNIVLGGLLGLVLLFVLGWGVLQARKRPTMAGSPLVQTTEPSPPKELDFRNAMRKLWEDHVTWTRMYIVSAAYDNPDTNQVSQRLLQNQADIGNAIRPFYGDKAADQLTALLKAHITTAADVVTAAKKNDQTALNTANDTWYQNANEIADFLSQANPDISNDMIRAEMKDHLDLTKQQAVDTLGNKFDASITGYDKLHTQILGMADMISGAIIKQFPDKFK